MTKPNYNKIRKLMKDENCWLSKKFRKARKVTTIDKSTRDADAIKFMPVLNSIQEKRKRGG